MKKPGLDLSGRVPELDGIRGIAIGMVVLWHLYFVSSGSDHSSVLYYLHFFGRLTWTGVDLFFVLSGFLIGGILLDNRRATNYFKVFYTRRFFRIVPAYLVCVAAFYALDRLIESGMTSRFNFLKLFQVLPWLPHLFFLQNFWMAARNDAGILVITWSLCIEEQFYLTLPLLVRFLSPRRLLTFVCAAVLAAPLFRLAVLFLWPGHRMANYVLPVARGDALMLGVLGAIIMRHQRSKEWLQTNRVAMRLIIAVLSLGVLALLKFSHSYDAFGIQTAGFTWMAFFYLALVLYAVSDPASVLSSFLRWQPLRALGELAYGIYLNHTLVIWVLFGAIYASWPSIRNLQSLGVGVLALAIIFLVARVSWLYFEKPLMRLGQRTSYKFGGTGLSSHAPTIPAEGG